MQPLKITATMAGSIAVSDDWTPAIENLLEYLILDKENLVSANPTPEDITKTRPLVDTNMPLAKGDLNGQWYWQASSPSYQILGESIERYRKSWHDHDNNLKWGKNKKWDSSQGAFKNWDLPLYLRIIRHIDWFVVGDKFGIGSLLQNCKRLGKKRSQGYGLVRDWNIQEIPEDWHLWKTGKLMRPIPYEVLKSQGDIQDKSFPLLDWGWRPTITLPENKALCIMPQIIIR